MNILGVETSCDEAGLALIDANGKVIAEKLASHAELCEQHGGVLPEVVAREHMRILPSLYQAFLKENALSHKDIHAVAVTSGPGLVSSLLVGCGFARGLSRSLGCPLYGINHLQAHVLVARMAQPVEYPFLALLVSGGHTALYKVEAPDVLHTLGQTYDDAVGEAFDKVARLLGIPYPGGARLEKLALQGKNFINFPKPLLNRDSLDFSFSGLKASVARYVEKITTLDDQTKADIAYSFQESVAAVVVAKITLALDRDHQLRRVVLTGGVAANTRLREAIQGALPQEVSFFCPPVRLCTDNGVMIAWAAHELRRSATIQKGYDVIARPNMPL